MIENWKNANTLIQKKCSKYNINMKQYIRELFLEHLPCEYPLTKQLNQTLCKMANNIKGYQLSYSQKTVK